MIQPLDKRIPPDQTIPTVNTKYEWKYNIQL